MKIFKILLAAYRPLTLGEMQIALKVERDSESTENLEMESEDHFGENLQEYCGFFISVNSGQVYFLHQTCRASLLARMQPSDSSLAIPRNKHNWRHSISIQQVHLLLADCSIVYLKFPEWLEEKNEYGPTDHNMINQHTNGHSFLNHTVRRWAIQLQQAEDIADRVVLNDSLKLCNLQSKRFCPWFQLYWESTYHSTKDPRICRFEDRIVLRP